MRAGSPDLSFEERQTLYMLREEGKGIREISSNPKSEIVRNILKKFLVQNL